MSILEMILEYLFDPGSGGVSQAYDSAKRLKMAFWKKILVFILLLFVLIVLAVIAIILFAVFSK